MKTTVKIISLFIISTLMISGCGGGGGGGTNVQKFNVSFDSQGGSSVNSQLIESGSNITEPAAPVKMGYIFDGWHRDASCAQAWNFNNDTVTEDLTLYAKWKTYTYSVTFDSQSATTAANPGVKSVSSPSTTVGTLPVPPTKSGYYFAGWYTETNGGGIEFISTTVVTGNLTVYANWSSNPTYTVTFDSQSATTDASPTSKTVVSPSINVGTLPTPPTKTGYIFGGWYTAINGGGSQFLANTTVSDSITVYAKWNSYSYTVSFDSRGGSSVSSKIVSSPNTTVNLMPVDPTKAGYSFGGWWTDVNGGGDQFSSGTPVIESITVYANWTPNNNTVTFNANGGTGSMSAQTIATDSTMALTANLYTRDGYSFAGWATSSTGNIEYSNGADFTMGTSSIILYAKWTPNNYTVSFDPNGGSGSMTPQTISCDSTAQLTANGFTKDGAVFSGWATTQTGAVVYTDRQNYTMGTASIILYAKWSELPKITTTPIKNNMAFTPYIAGTSARGGGNVTLQGDASVSDRGLCWNTTGSPTINDQKASNSTSTGTGIFSNTTLAGLTVDTTYYVRAYATSSVGTAYGEEISFSSGKSYGTDFGGGYVFYNDGNAHGLISAKENQSTSCQWDWSTSIYISGTMKTIGTGSTNTDIIILKRGTGGAAGVARSCSDGGYHDWFLPSLDELSLMYSNLKHYGIGNFGSNGYWSSSEYDFGNAWGMNFGTGSQGYCNKTGAIYIRAVRAF